MSDRERLKQFVMCSNWFKELKEEHDKQDWYKDKDILSPIDMRSVVNEACLWKETERGGLFWKNIDLEVFHYADEPESN